MSISSTGLYGSATIVNTDIFNDVQALKEQVTTLSTSYWVWVGDKETGDWVWSETGEWPESPKQETKEDQDIDEFLKI
jgi:hypothetical protein